MVRLSVELVFDRLSYSEFLVCSEKRCFSAAVAGFSDAARVEELFRSIIAIASVPISIEIACPEPGYLWPLPVTITIPVTVRRIDAPAIIIVRVVEPLFLERVPLSVGSWSSATVLRRPFVFATLEIPIDEHCSERVLEGVRGLAREVAEMWFDSVERVEIARVPKAFSELGISYRASLRGSRRATYCLTIERSPRGLSLETPVPLIIAIEMPKILVPKPSVRIELCQW